MTNGHPGRKNPEWPWIFQTLIWFHRRDENSALASAVTQRLFYILLSPAVLPDLRAASIQLLPKNGFLRHPAGRWSE
jgi:hypothetical protein